jgi:hypothetical protein
MKTHAQLLASELAKIVALADEFHEVSSINYDPDRAGRLSRRTGVAVAALFPDSVWGPLDDEGRRRQRYLLDQWGRWLEKARLVFHGDAAVAKRELDTTAHRVTKWIERSKPDWSVPRALADAGVVFRKHVQPLVDLLAPFQVPGPRVVVPDTNVILRNQEPEFVNARETAIFRIL